VARVAIQIGLVASAPVRPTVSAPAAAFTGEQISVAYFAPPGASPMDWIALYRVGADVALFLDWKYIHAAGAGAVTLRVPATAGTYEARYLLDNGYIVAARSGPIVAVDPAVENHPPVWDMAPIQFREGEPMSFPLTARASDADGDAMDFALVAGLDPQYEGAFHLDEVGLVLRYDGRPLGAPADGTPLDINSGIRISASDRRT
jgi:hypothetical protein